jgi:hypothetical protein
MRDADFFNLEPEDFPALNLNLYSAEALRELAYFLWTMYPTEDLLMQWRKEKLLPLLSIDDIIYLDDDDSEDTDSSDSDDDDEVYNED